MTFPCADIRMKKSRLYVCSPLADKGYTANQGLKLVKVIFEAKYELIFMLDWGNASCLWSINDTAKELYGFLLIGLI